MRKVPHNVDRCFPEMPTHCPFHSAMSSSMTIRWRGSVYCIVATAQHAPSLSVFVPIIALPLFT